MSFISTSWTLATLATFLFLICCLLCWEFLPPDHSALEPSHHSGLSSNCVISKRLLWILHIKSPSSNSPFHYTRYSASLCNFVHNSYYYLLWEQECYMSSSLLCLLEHSRHLLFGNEWLSYVVTYQYVSIFLPWFSLLAIKKKSVSGTIFSKTVKIAPNNKRTLNQVVICTDTYFNVF